MRSAKFALLALALLVVASWGVAQGAEPDKKDETITANKVISTQDAQKNYNSVKVLTDKNETLNVRLNDRGMALAREMPDRRFELHGDFVTEGGERILVVNDYRDLGPSLSENKPSTYTAPAPSAEVKAGYEESPPATDLRQADEGCCCR